MVVFQKQKKVFLFRVFLITAALMGLLFTSSLASGPPTLAKRDTFNIGFVLYSKSSVPGTLNARWNYANVYSGKGVATGGPKIGFAGHYHVRYFLENGEFSDEYDLVIEKTGNFYDVSWITNGKVSARGVGMMVKNGLAVGWRRVDQ